MSGVRYLCDCDYGAVGCVNVLRCECGTEVNYCLYSMVVARMNMAENATHTHTHVKRQRHTLRVDRVMCKGINLRIGCKAFSRVTGNNEEDEELF